MGEATALVAQRGDDSGLTSSKVLAKSVMWGFIGQVLPMVVALFSIPFLIKGMGVERFGILALSWLVIGYFSVFDLGVGRALAKLLSEKLGSGKEAEIPGLVWTSLCMMLLLGLIGALVIGLAAPWLVRQILKIPPRLQPETLQSFYLLALFIPVVIIIGGLRGILEATQRFKLIASVTIPTGVYTYLGPLLVLPFSNKLPVVVAVLVGGRLVASFAYLALCLKVIPALRHNVSLQPRRLGELIRFGSWMTITNIIGPFMIYLDRFLIGMLLSVVAVAYYVIPYDVITRLWFLTGTLTSVLFPAFSFAYHADRGRVLLLFSKGLKYLILVLFPIVLCTIAFAYDGLDLWLGQEFAVHSEQVLQWLAVGVFFSSIAGLSSTLLQGVGRPDIQARLYFVELPLYLGALWWAVPAYGVVGAAVVWTLRIMLDGLAIFWVHSRLMPEMRRPIKKALAAVAAALLLFLVAGFLQGLGAKVVFVVLVLSAFGSATWNYALSPKEKNVIKRYFPRGIS